MGCDAVMVARPGLNTLTLKTFKVFVIVAMLASEEVSVQAAGEFEVGGKIVKVLSVVEDWV